MKYSSQVYENNLLIDHQYYHHAIEADKIHSSDLQEDHFFLTFPYGKMEFNLWYFDGILIRYTKTSFNGHYCFENKNVLNMVGLEFNLNGSFEIHHMNQVYRVQSRQHNIIYSPKVDNIFYNRTDSGETFKIYFLPHVFLELTRDSNDTLKRFGDHVLAGKPSVVAPVSPVLHSELNKAIQEVINCRYTGGLKKVFMLSKCMEILVMQAEAFDRVMNSEQSTSLIIKTEKDQIIYARDYLLEHADNPPSLSELSKIVGMNEYKLKKSFKETFHTTVFGYLTDHRMEQARKTLLENHSTISELAYDLGYSSPQHFSSAFKKKFGVPPKRLKEN